MLNKTIRLQAVLEVISSQTTFTLNHTSSQLTQIRAAIFQIRLAVDCLLADEGESAAGHLSIPKTKKDLLPKATDCKLMQA